MKKVIRTGLIMALVVLSGVSLFGASESYSQAGINRGEGGLSCEDIQIFVSGRQVQDIPINGFVEFRFINVADGVNRYSGEAQLFVKLVSDVDPFADSEEGSAEEKNSAAVSDVDFRDGNGTAGFVPMSSGSILRRQLLVVGTKVEIELKTKNDARRICGLQRLVSISEGAGISPTDTNNFRGEGAQYCCNTTTQCEGWLGIESSCGGLGNTMSTPELFLGAGQCTTGKRCYVPSNPDNPQANLKNLGDACNALNDRCVQGLCLPTASSNSSNTNIESLVGTCQMPCAQGDFACLAQRYDLGIGAVCEQSDPVVAQREGAFTPFTPLASSFCTGGCREVFMEKRPSYIQIQVGEDAVPNDSTSVVICRDSGNCPTPGGCILSYNYSRDAKMLNVTAATTCLIEARTYRLTVVQGSNIVATFDHTQTGSDRSPIILNVNDFELSNEPVRIAVQDTSSTLPACQVDPRDLILSTEIINPGTDGRPIDPNRPVQEITPAAGPCNCPGLRSLCIQDGVFNAEALKDDSASSIRSKISDRIDLTAEEKTYAVSCFTCINNGDTWTDTLGCVNTTASGIFTSILRIGLGTIGGIALLRFAGIGYQYAFTKDDAKLKDAVNKVFALFGAILLVLFSVVILRAIGVNLLDVVPPGFFGN